MPTVTFKENFSFAEDGITQKAFPAGETYEVSQSCADSALQVGALAEPDAMEDGQDTQEDRPPRGKPGPKPKPKI